MHSCEYIYTHYVLTYVQVSMCVYVIYMHNLSVGVYRLYIYVINIVIYIIRYV